MWDSKLKVRLVLFEAGSFDIGCKGKKWGGPKCVNYFKDPFSKTIHPKNLKKI